MASNMIQLHPSARVSKNEVILDEQVVKNVDLLGDLLTHCEQKIHEMLKDGNTLSPDEFVDLSYYNNVRKEALTKLKDLYDVKEAS